MQTCSAAIKCCTDMTPALIAACTGAELVRASAWALPISAAMVEFEINSPRRQAAFLAQVGHESNGFMWMHELWGPTAAQKRYEPPSDLAARLGNTQPGDGFRYRGRGPIQCTGRANYRSLGVHLGLDLENHPELLDNPTNACRVSAAFFATRGCNVLADRDDFETITRRVNGGLNGYDDRLARWAKGKTALRINDGE